MGVILVLVFFLQLAVLCTIITIYKRIRISESLLKIIASVVPATWTSKVSTDTSTKEESVQVSPSPKTATPSAWISAFALGNSSSESDNHTYMSMKSIHTRDSILSTRAICNSCTHSCPPTPPNSVANDESSKCSHDGYLYDYPTMARKL